MVLCAATKVCCRGAFALASILASCAGPGVLSEAQVGKCRDAERAYRAGTTDYQQLRDELSADPATACWLVRMFVRDLFAVREGRPLGEDDGLLRAAARIEDPVEARALAEIVALGAVAVPTLVGDLLLHSQPQPRELGIELMSRIGAPAIAPLQEVARTGEPRQRRAAARTLGAIGVDANVFATLQAMSADEDYSVRADALRSLRGGGGDAERLLIDKLRSDTDPFVRRVAAETLVAFPGQASAVALVEYLERCDRDRDFPGEKAAQASLQRVASVRGPRTPGAWRIPRARLDGARGRTLTTETQNA